MFTVGRSGEVPGGRDGFRASSGNEGFPTLQRGTGKTGRGDDREDYRLVTVTGGSWLGGSRHIGSGRSSKPAIAGWGGGGRVRILEVAGLGLQNGVILILFKKKLKSIELAGSQGTDWFVRFTDWTASSSGPTPIQSQFGPIDRIGPERWPTGPVRFLKHWFF